jgi:hypothetical protein
MGTDQWSSLSAELLKHSIILPSDASGQRLGRALLRDGRATRGAPLP